MKHPATILLVLISIFLSSCGDNHYHYRNYYELSDEVSDEIKEELLENLREDLYFDLYNDIRDEIYDSLRHELLDSLDNKYVKKKPLPGKKNGHAKHEAHNTIIEKCIEALKQLGDYLAQNHPDLVW
ncbi:MAG: hypothetical protein IJL38_07230 [Bacteroidales bacterium]|nr:hypothetical protein [Bacteroidales bacterium]